MRARLSGFAAGVELQGRVDSLFTCTISHGLLATAVLASARFKDFRALKDAKLTLSPLTVLVGPNGSGKSTALDGVHRVLQGLRVPGTPRTALGAYHEVFGSLGWLESYLRRPEATGFAVGVASPRAEILLEATPSEARRFRVLARINDMPFSFDDDARDSGRWELFVKEADVRALRSVVRLRLDPTRLAEPHYSDLEVPRVEYDGSGLASVLQYVQGARDGRLEAIEQSLASVVPTVRQVRTMPARISRTESEVLQIGETTQVVQRQVTRTGVRFEVDFKNLGWIPASALSEGTLLALGLITVLHRKQHPPRLVLLDDLDMGLHPRAQLALVGELRRLVEDRDLQVVCTSHSPFVVDCLKVEEVQLFGFTEEGYGRCRPLAEHPLWSKRQGFMRPGEFWSGVGEDWVGR